MFWVQYSSGIWRLSPDWYLSGNRVREFRKTKFYIFCGKFCFLFLFSTNSKNSGWIMIPGGSIILSVCMVSSNYLSSFLLVRDTKFRWSQSLELYSTAWYIFWWEGKNGGILSYFKWQTMSAFSPLEFHHLYFHIDIPP